MSCYNICKIKNVDSVDHVYCGIVLAPDDEYIIIDSERIRFSMNTSLESDILDEKIEVYSNSDLISGPEAAVEYIHDLNVANDGIFDNSENNFLATRCQSAIEEARRREINWSSHPTVNGVIDLLGWYIQTDEAVSLISATPITVSKKGFHSHFVIDVSSASGTPFAIRVTGTSVDESTGATTESDTEDINVTANGYYQTSKSWIDAVQLNIVETNKSCDLDIYRITYWDKGNQNFRILGSRLEFEPDDAVWSINLKILHIKNDGSFTYIDNVTLASTDELKRADNNEPGKYKRGDYNTQVWGSQDQGIIVLIDQTNIKYFYLEVKYE